MSRTLGNDSAFKDALWLLVFCGVAFVLHIFVGLSFMCANSIWSWSQRPLINPDNVMEVSMVVLPKSTSKMVQWNTKRLVSHGQKQANQKAPTPPRTSDLVHQTPDAQTNQGSPDRSDEMKRLVDMATVLSDLGPEADQDSTQSDPDSTSNEHVNLGSTGVPADPELARYIQKIRVLYHKNFNPLPTIVAANPKIECMVHVQFEMNTGRVTTVKMQRSSGNASYDGSAIRAVESVSTVPLPPDRFQAYFTDGYLMVFP